MEFLKIIALGIAFIWFGFYSFQKGREYERINGGNIYKKSKSK